METIDWRRIDRSVENKLHLLLHQIKQDIIQEITEQLQQEFKKLEIEKAQFEEYKQKFMQGKVQNEALSAPSSSAPVSPPASSDSGSSSSPTYSSSSPSSSSEGIGMGALPPSMEEETTPLLWSPNKSQITSNVKEEEKDFGRNDIVQEQEEEDGIDVEVRGIEVEEGQFYFGSYGVVAHVGCKGTDNRQAEDDKTDTEFNSTWIYDGYQPTWSCNISVHLSPSSVLTIQCKELLANITTFYEIKMEDILKKVEDEERKKKKKNDPSVESQENNDIIVSVTPVNYNQPKLKVALHVPT